MSGGTQELYGTTLIIDTYALGTNNTMNRLRFSAGCRNFYYKENCILELAYPTNKGILLNLPAFNLFVLTTTPRRERLFPDTVNSGKSNSFKVINVVKTIYRKILQSFNYLCHSLKGM